MDSNKIQSIRDYLLKYFPNDSHEDKYDFDRDVHKFKIRTVDNVLLALFSKEYLEDNDTKSIISNLEKIGLSDVLRKNESLNVIITNDGIKFESKFWPGIKQSLEKDRYKWRTPRGVAKENKISVEEVKKAFAVHADAVIKSSIPAETGEELYTTRQHFRSHQSPFVKLTSSLFTRVSSSSTGGSDEE